MSLIRGAAFQFATGFTLAMALGMSATASAYTGIKRMNGNFCVGDSDQFGSEYESTRNGTVVISGSAVCPFLSADDLQTGDGAGGGPLASTVKVDLSHRLHGMRKRPHGKGEPVHHHAKRGEYVRLTPEAPYTSACGTTATITLSNTDAGSGWYDHYADYPYVFVTQEASATVTIAGYRVYD